MGAADRLRARLRQAEVPDLAFRDQLPDGAGDVLDRHVRVDAVLVEQVDAIGPQPLQRRVGDARICSGRLSSPLGSPVSAST